MLTSRRPLLATLASLALAALATLPGAATAQDSSPQPVVKPGPAPAPSDAADYLIVTQVDPRTCAYPVCGGYFVKAVNRARTVCADGKPAAQCHAVELDTRALNWTDAQKQAFEAGFAKGQALVRGIIEPQPRGRFTGEVLRVTEAWQGQAASKPLGTFYNVKGTGIVCITAPCPSFSAQTLNSQLPPTTPELDLNHTGAKPEQVQAAYELLNDLKGTGILAVGQILPRPVHSLDGKPAYGRFLVASEIYLPAKP